MYIKQKCNEVLQHVMQLFKKKYKPDCEYIVNIKDIKIDFQFKIHPPHRLKYQARKKYYIENGTFYSKILLDQDFILVDGYTSYLIAKEFKLDKVPVYFCKNVD